MRGVRGVLQHPAEGTVQVEIGGVDEAVRFHGVRLSSSGRGGAIVASASFKYGEAEGSARTEASMPEDLPILFVISGL